MSEPVTIARPYAEAVFGIAREANALARWSSLLQLAATVVRDPDMAALIDDPNVPREKLSSVLEEILGEALDDAGRNFLRVLIANDRLALLPHIAELYEEARRAYEGELRALLVSAFPLTEVQEAELVAALEKRFGRRVQASTRVDPDLIGGVRIEVGDVVIDGSVAGQLEKMAAALKS